MKLLYIKNLLKALEEDVIHFFKDESKMSNYLIKYYTGISTRIKELEAKLLDLGKREKETTDSEGYDFSNKIKNIRIEKARYVNRIIRLKKKFKEMQEKSKNYKRDK